MQAESKVLYHFKNFILDPSRKSLWRDDELVSLTPKALETLIVLVKHKGAVVDKETLLNTVWSETFVEEATLAQNISILRKVLGADFEKQVIENIPRRGYRIAFEVDEFTTDDEYFVVEKYKQTNVILTDSIDDTNSANSHITSDGTRRISSPEAENKVAGESRMSPLPVAGNKLKWVMAALCFLTVIGFIFWWTFPRPGHSKFRELSFKKLFSSNNAVHTAISPDGNYIALVNREGGKYKVLIRQLNSEKSIEIFSSTELEIFGVTFSKDSQNIYYAGYAKKPLADGSRIGNLYKIPKLGGTSALVITDIDSQLSLSPDERRGAFVRNNFKGNKSYLMIADLVTGEERILVERDIRNAFARPGPAWSPDGKTIVCPAHKKADTNKQMEVLAIDAGTGTAQSFISHKFEWIGKTAWLNDGSGILFPANSQNVNDQIWKASFPSGETELYTNGINGYYDLSISSSSNSFVTIQSIPNTNFWIQPVAPAAERKRIGQGFSEFNTFMPGMTFLSDQQVILGSTRNNNADIWQMNIDNGTMIQLTTDPHSDYSPEVTPDGRYIFFLSNRDGVSNLWRMNSDGTEVRQIYKSSTNLVPGITSDGHFVYFTQRFGQEDFPSLWKIPVDGGDAVRVTDNLVINPRISPDGKWIACHFARQAGQTENNDPLKLSIISAADGSLIKQFEVEQVRRIAKLFWSPGSRHLYFLKTSEGISAIYRQPINSDQAVKIVETNPDIISRFAISPNDDFIVYESGNRLQDVVLVENTK